ncbi:unnamed protein product [Cochlearia groenlandica]
MSFLVSSIKFMLAQEDHKDTNKGIRFTMYNSSYMICMPYDRWMINSSYNKQTNKRRRTNKDPIAISVREIVINPSDSAANLDPGGKTRIKFKIPARFRGVRQRPWGKWAAEIRCGKTHGGLRKGRPHRIWLGTSKRRRKLLELTTTPRFS